MKHIIDSRRGLGIMLLPGTVLPSAVVLGAVLLGGCAADLAPQPVLPVDTGIKSAAARPLQTGMLSVSPDGTFALASDDVGEAVHLVTLAADALSSQKIALTPGDEPGRSALTNTHAYVTSPRSGAVIVVDLEAASVVSRLTPCPAPEGVAIDEESLHVACRGGELVTLSLPDGLVERSLVLDEDLKDVVVLPEGLVVSRFARGELLWLDEAGTLIDRTTPGVQPNAESAVAWRTILAPDGNVLVAHQTDSDQDLSGGYSGGDCGSITMPTVTTFTPPSATSNQSVPLQVKQLSITGSAGTFDIAVVGSDLIMVFPGNEFARQFASPTVNDNDLDIAGSLIDFRAIQRLPMDSDPGLCTGGAGDPPGEEPAVPLTIASLSAGPFAGRGLILTQSPAKVRVLDSTLEVLLHDEDRQNTGLALFQMSVGSGVSCASCHPGGRADARTWRLANGMRRTQPLEGGVSHLGAFHWDAEFSNFDALIDDVMTVRMGLAQELSSEHKSVLLSFIDAIPKATLPAVHQDVAAVDRGRALFESPSTECATCHSGADFTNNQAFDVGTGGVFVTPSLVGVGYRSPLMHDGCASDLEQRFGVCGGGDKHGKTSQLSADEESDLVAFMSTL